jgi:hypothetical protein
MDFAKTIPAERTAAQRLCLSPAVQLDTAQRRELLLLRVHHLGERAGMAEKKLSVRNTNEPNFITDLLDSEP